MNMDHFQHFLFTAMERLKENLRKRMYRLSDTINILQLTISSQAVVSYFNEPPMQGDQYGSYDPFARKHSLPFPQTAATITTQPNFVRQQKPF